MFIIKNNDLGEITVAKDVIETIAGLATIDCYGLVGMVSQNIQTELTSILGLESIRKGVSVRDSEDGLIVDVYVVVGYGIKISEVAHNVMQKVTYVLENNAGVSVASVNVNVKGIRVIKENK
ncbi:Putative alkaline-shock protein [Candidatus Syntrophocurvum alkaliphilum]|uniref:Alkaline-shock protein n=1 Tax=Candidatus Syntrophocurvum alkaliphilum TaxID=2293317 RepID=A0A6I6DF33_9FIRM|nr:Asp23/Gls24 family envelope stress response protein [Candidatus Syntrophocurvum alkaliphilum]QGT99071.1 Putative alkaline-shock protein [Candidatus Syntrophocurvum alkaliphilum]